MGLAIKELLKIRKRFLGVDSAQSRRCAEMKARNRGRCIKEQPQSRNCRRVRIRVVQTHVIGDKGT
jgi:hypothetical protein